MVVVRDHRARVHDAFVRSDRWSWRRDGTRFEERDFVVSDLDLSVEMNAFHMELFAPSSPWKVVYESDDIVILERRDAA